MTKTIKIKVFKEGKHRDSLNREFEASREVIEKIVNNYNNQPESEKHWAPLRPVSHNDRNKAGGFVDSLEYADGFMFANVFPTPELVKDVRENRLKTVSIGLTENRDNLDHIAILGATNPAVKGLGLLEFSEDSLIEFSENEIKDFNLITFSELTIMDPRIAKLRQDLVDKINAAFGTQAGTDINALVDEAIKANGLDQPLTPAPAPVPQPQPQPQPQPAPLFSETPEYKAIMAKQEKLERENKELQFSAFVDKNIEKILPANREKVIEILHSVSDKAETNFSEADKKFSGVDLVQSFIEALPKIIDDKPGKVEFSQAKTDREEIANAVKQAQGK
jgi:hypothetical protein